MDEQKNVTFESERVLKKEKLKRILIPIACLAGAVLIVFLVAWIISKLGSKKYESNQDLQFTYTWVEEGNGNIRLTIDRVGAADYEWVYAGEETPIVIVEKPRQSREKTEFTIKPSVVGRVELIFYLEHKTEKKHLCELAVLAEVSETEGSLKLTFLSSDSKVKTAPTSGGEEIGFPYEIYMNDNDNLIVSIQDPLYYVEESENAGETADNASDGSSGESTDSESESSGEGSSSNPYAGLSMYEAMYLSDEEFDIWLEWYESTLASEVPMMTEEEYSQWLAEHENTEGPIHQEEPQELPDDFVAPETPPVRSRYDWDMTASDETIIRILGVTYEDGLVHAHMRAGSETGTCQVEIFSPSAAVKITMSLSVNEKGEIELLSHSIDTYEPTPESEPEGQEG